MHHSRFDIGQAGILKTANLDISIDCAPYYSSIWNPSEGSSSSSSGGGGIVVTTYCLRSMSLRYMFFILSTWLYQMRTERQPFERAFYE